MLGNQEHTRFYVSNLGYEGTAGTAYGVAAAPPVLNSLVENEVALFDLQNRELDGTDWNGDGVADTPSNIRYFRIGIKEKNGLNIRLSDTIDFTTIKSKTLVQSKAPKEKVAYIGYQGTGSATIETPNAIADYIIRMTLKSSSKFNGDFPFVKVAAYRTTLADVALTNPKGLTHGIYKSLVSNFQRDQQLEKFCRFEIVTDGALGAVGTAKVFFGDPYITFTANVTVAAGAVIKVGNGTYFVEKGVTAGTSVKLTTPYQDRDNAVGVTVSTVTVTNATLWGIRIVGIPRKFSESKPFGYDKADWEMDLVGFSNPTYEVTVAHNKGIGTQEECLELEYDLQLNEVMPQVIGIPVIIPRKVVCSDRLQYWGELDGSVVTEDNTPVLGSYDILTITWADKSTNNLLTANPESPKAIILATGYASTTAADLLVDIV